MRIGMFVDCDDQSINGVVTSVMTLKLNLEKLGHTVFLMVPEPKMPQDPDPKICRFISTELSFQPSHRFAYPFPITNFKKIKDLNLDVIHIHTPFSLGCIGRFLAFVLGVPMVLTHHTLWEEYAHYVPFRGKSFLKAFGIWLGRSFANASRFVIAPSVSVKARLIQQGVTAHIEVMPTGIDPELFQKGDRVSTRQKYNLDPSQKVCLYVGRLAQEKSVDFLIRAFAQIVSKDPAARFFVVGDGPARVGLEALSKDLGLEEKIIFTGFIKRSELKHYQAASDVFMFASVTETQGLVTLEAMAAGLPVIAVEATGSSDTVIHNKTGILTPASIPEFVGATQTLLANQKLREIFGEAGRKRAETFLSSHMAKETERIYLEATLPGFQGLGLPSGL